MRFAIVGAGALGCVYGARLAYFGNCAVSYVVRSLDRAPKNISVTRINGADVTTQVGASVTLKTPTNVDVVFVAVRVDQLDDNRLDELATLPESVALVFLTPLLPADEKRVRACLAQHHGPHLLAALPGVVAYEPETPADPTTRAIRYWTPRLAPTVLESGGLHAEDLVAMLLRSGLPAKTATGVLATNQATTIASFPVMLAISKAGTVDELMEDRALVKLSLEAAAEARFIAQKVGELHPVASLFFKFASPLLVKTGVALGRRKSAEAIRYLDIHFGHKLAAQHAAIGQQILALGQSYGLKTTALATLLAQ